MGTASGNLMGYWDRHGMPDFYAGPLNGGVAPLYSNGTNAAIVSLWATRAGLDGRPLDRPGHVDDYYISFDHVEDPDLGRPEHTWDCLADFMGMDQLKWTNMADECTGNADGFCFVYWDTNGNRRVNYQPTNSSGDPVPDVQSGLRAWTRWRGYDATVFTQLADFNPAKPLTSGFTFADLKNEIDSGYPVLLFLQAYNVYSRQVAPGLNVNPEIHAMLAFGYSSSSSANYVTFKTSWAQGNGMRIWNAQSWVSGATLPVRGMIGYRPLPEIRRWSAEGANLFLEWDGPASDRYYSDGVGPATTNRVHGYIVEAATSGTLQSFDPVSSVLLTNRFTLTNCPSPAYVRVRLVRPADIPGA